MTKPIIYLPRRAIENAVSIPGVRPQLFFAVMWPLWQVEISGQIDEAQNYDLLDRFVVRAIADAGIDDQRKVGELLGLPQPTVEGCVRQLASIGHLTRNYPKVHLTDIGLKSHRDGRRIVRKESRQLLLFDRFTNSPLPKPYYARSVKILSEPVAPPDQYFGPRLINLFATNSRWDESSATALSNRPDRGDFNLPDQLTDLRVREISEAFIPLYLIRSADDILAYSAVSESRDTFFERVCRQERSIMKPLEAASTNDPSERWSTWLEKKKVRGARLIRQRGGMWRAEVPRDQFGAKAAPFKDYQLASYEVSDNHLLQVWCADVKLRRRVMLDRAIGLTSSPSITDRATLLARCQVIADQLEVDPPTEDELRGRFQPGEKSAESSRLDQLLSTR